MSVALGMVGLSLVELHLYEGGAVEEEELPGEAAVGGRQVDGHPVGQQGEQGHEPWVVRCRCNARGDRGAGDQVQVPGYRAAPVPK